jgi:hypothetical protein
MKGEGNDERMVMQYISYRNETRAKISFSSEGR